MRRGRATSRSDRWIVGVSLVTSAVMMLTGDPSAEAAEHSDGESPKGRSIVYEGATFNQTDLQGLGVGAAGFWFPQFDAPEPVTNRSTRERARDELPGWIAPLNHFWLEDPVDQGCTPVEMLSGCVPTFFFRSFSQDAPAYSKGGQPSWATVRLPDGDVGLTGAVVDPDTRGSSNNTVNRIQLRGEVPDTFYLHILTDNTAGEHDPVNRLRARGHLEWVDRGHGPSDVLGLDEDQHVEAPNWLHSQHTRHLRFNGIPNVYTYRYDGFEAGDYIKIQLNGAPEPKGGASIGGLLFDEEFAPPPSFQPAARGAR